jgi:AraC-like DNA-binding protein
MMSKHHHESCRPARAFDFHCQPSRGARITSPITIPLTVFPISMNAPRPSRSQRQQTKLSIDVISVSGSRFGLGICSPSRDHQAEPLSLGRIAQMASSHYFCKMFKNATGDEVHRLPLESSSGEIEDAFAQSHFASERSCVGKRISSMTNFNREFKRIVDRSPTQFAKPFRRCVARCVERVQIALPIFFQDPDSA